MAPGDEFEEIGPSPQASPEAHCYSTAIYGTDDGAGFGGGTLAADGGVFVVGIATAAPGAKSLPARSRQRERLQA